MAWSIKSNRCCNVLCRYAAPNALCWPTAILDENSCFKLFFFSSKKSIHVYAAGNIFVWFFVRCNTARFNSNWIPTSQWNSQSSTYQTFITLIKEKRSINVFFIKICHELNYSKQNYYHNYIPTLDKHTFLAVKERHKKKPAGLPCLGVPLVMSLAKLWKNNNFGSNFAFFSSDVKSIHLVT